jgi:hypothetical protein
VAWFVIAMAAVWVTCAALVVGATVLKFDWFVDSAHNDDEGFFDMAVRMWRLSNIVSFAPIIVVGFFISKLLGGGGQPPGRKAD